MMSHIAVTLSNAGLAEVDHPAIQVNPQSHWDFTDADKNL